MKKPPNIKLHQVCRTVGSIETLNESHIHAIVSIDTAWGPCEMDVGGRDGIFESVLNRVAALDASIEAM